MKQITFYNGVVANFQKMSKDVLDYVEKTQGVVLAGGSLRTLLCLSDTIVDYDLFFTSEDARDKTVAYFTGLNDCESTFICPKKELYSFVLNKKIKIQLITKEIYLNEMALIDSFDINACRCAWNGTDLTYAEDFVNDVMCKRITFNKITYPVATIKRVEKYIRKGYYMNKESRLHLVNLLSDKTWNDTEKVFYID